jgi:hypothetical protein
MATTRLSDVIYGPAFVPSVINRIADRSGIRNSPIVEADEETRQYLNAPGSSFEAPFWNDISGDANVSSDDPTQNATPLKITQGKSIGRKIRRNQGWQAARLVKSLLQEDPLDVISTLIADYWVREEQKVLAATLNGIFAASSMSGNILNVASEDPAGNSGANAVYLDAEVASNGHALLGEYGMGLTGVMMHSRIYWNLEAQRALTYEVDPVTGLRFTRWGDKTVFVSDSCPRVAGSTSGFKYTTYFFGPGAIAYGEITGAGGPDIPVEIASTPSAGNGEGVVTVWYRRHWGMHPRGMSFTGAPTGDTATNTELATGTNWARVWDNRLVRVVAVVTNG